jgi:hypothetical protein
MNIMELSTHVKVTVLMDYPKVGADTLQSLHDARSLKTDLRAKITPPPAVLDECRFANVRVIDNRYKSRSCSKDSNNIYGGWK